LVIGLSWGKKLTVSAIAEMMKRKDTGHLEITISIFLRGGSQLRTAVTVEHHLRNVGPVVHLRCLRQRLDPLQLQVLRSQFHLHDTQADPF